MAKKKKVSNWETFNPASAVVYLVLCAVVGGLIGYFASVA